MHAPSQHLCSAVQGAGCSPVTLCFEVSGAHTPGGYADAARRPTQVPKLIHPLPPNEVRVPKGNGSDAEDIEEEPPTPHPLTDTWMQVRHIATHMDKQ